MKYLRVIFLFVFIAIFSVAVKASDEDEDGYDARSCKMVTNTKSSCNQGAEPFYKFIKKFKTNKSFRTQRTNYCDNGQDWTDGCVEQYATEFIDNEKFQVYRWKDEMCATWTDVSKNLVVYKRGYFGSGDDSGWSFIATFQRINGKWYLVTLIVV